MKRILIAFLAGLLLVSCTSENTAEPPEQLQATQETEEIATTQEKAVSILEWRDSGDGTYEIYSVSDSDNRTTVLPFTAADYDSVTPVYDACTGRLTGALCRTDADEHEAFYDFTQGKFTVEVQGAGCGISSQTYRGRCITTYPMNQRTHSSVVDCTDGETLYTAEGQLRAVTDGDVLLYLFSEEFILSGFAVYNEEFRQISEADKWYAYAEITPDGNILLIEGTEYDTETGSWQRPVQFTVIDRNGEHIRTSRTYDRVIAADGDRVYVVENGETRLYDSGENLLASFTAEELADSDELLTLHPALSGYLAEEPEEPVSLLIASEDEIPEGVNCLPVYVVHYRYADAYSLGTEKLVQSGEYPAEFYCYYPCVTNTPQLLDYQGNGLLIDDGGYRLFDLKTGESTDLPFTKKEFPSVYVACDSLTKEVAGFTCRDTDDSAQFFHLESMSFTIGADAPLDNLERVTSNNLCFSIVQREDGFNSCVYDIRTGELLREIDGILQAKERQITLEDGTLQRCTYYTATRNVSCYSNYQIYNDRFELISERTHNFFSILSDGSVLLTGENGTTFLHRGRDGSILHESPEFDKILFLCEEYAFVADDGKLKLYDSTGEYIRTLSGWTDEAWSHDMISGKFESKEYIVDEYRLGYYRNVGTPDEPVYEKVDSLDRYPGGIYYITEYLNESLGLDGLCAEFIFDPETGESGILASAYVGGYSKPVLYLYPEEETEVTVSFADPDRLTVVYPDYPDTGWQVTAAPDGTLTDETGRSYYALYWEESGTLPIDWSTGFCVPRDELTAFLEEKLAAIGLTDREANEFIIYWLPVLQKNEYSLIRFELTESRQMINELYISPAPDSLLRFAMHVRASDRYEKMTEQELPSFERGGFTAVEWGGVVHAG